MKTIKSKNYNRLQKKTQNFYNREEDWDPKKHIDPETNRPYDDPLVAPDDQITERMYPRKKEKTEKDRKKNQP